MTTYKTSEWVSPGHPDKIADCISEFILDKLIKKDKHVRYALEVQIKDNYVSLAGEVTTKFDVSEDDYEEWTKDAVNVIGYTKEYQKRFGKENTICGDELIVNCNISQQSPDIAQGVNNDGWGDQGIFFGYFCRETECGQGVDYFLARRLGRILYTEAMKGEQPFGLDIKTQVTVELEESGEFEVKDIVVAIPTIPGKITDRKLRATIQKIIKEHIPEGEGANLIVNGTGSYHIHGPIGDSGTTGRKLVVDFYGSRSRIGGGCVDAETEYLSEKGW